MTQENNLITQTNHPVAFNKPTVLGAGFALLLISIFLFGVNDPNPEWEKTWVIRPLIIVPLAGAVGGAFYSFMDYQISRGVKKAGAFLLRIVVYLIGLWLGFFLGLAGTLWH